MNCEPPDIDFGLKRPFIQFSGGKLLKTIEVHILSESVDIEIATLALDELKRRKRAARIARDAQKLFREEGIKPIPWLQNARESLKILEPPTTTNNKGYLYVILKDGFTEKKGFYVPYVGVSAKRPEDRFKQHKSGNKAGRGLPKRGKQLLRSLCWPGYKENRKWKTVPSGSSIRYLWESALHLCLDSAVPEVHGDVQFPLNKWPEEFQVDLQRKLKKL